jgi:hypothetical protein
MFEVNVWLPAVGMFVLYEQFATSEGALDCMKRLKKGGIECSYGGFLNV